MNSSKSIISKAFDAALLVSAITLTGYLVTFGYYLGAYSYYGIPGALIPLDIQHIFPAILATITVSILILLVVELALLIIWAIFFGTRKFLRSFNKTVMVPERPRLRDIFSNTQGNLFSWIIALMFCFVVAITGAYGAGSTGAEFKTSYFVAGSDPNCLIVAIKGDSYICAIYDPKAERITHSFEIRMMESGIKIDSKMIKLKPWPPKPPPINLLDVFDFPQYTP